MGLSADASGHLPRDRCRCRQIRVTPILDSQNVTRIVPGRRRYQSGNPQRRPRTLQNPSAFPGPSSTDNPSAAGVGAKRLFGPESCCLYRHATILHFPALALERATSVDRPFSRARPSSHTKQRPRGQHGMEQIETADSVGHTITPPERSPFAGTMDRLGRNVRSSAW